MVSNNKRGFSLIEIMVAIGLMGVMAAIFAGMMANQQSGARLSAEKMATMDLTRLLINTFGDNSVCTGVLTNPALTPGAPFSAGVGSTINIPSVPSNSISNAVLVAQAGQLVSSSISTKLKVNTIQFKNFNSTGIPNQYLADFAVTFTGGLIAMNPLVLKVLVNTTPSGVVSNCGASSGVQLLGSIVVDSTLGSVSTGDSPWNIGHSFCTYLNFTPGTTYSNLLITGSVSYGTNANLVGASDHRYTFYGAVIDQAAGTATVCVDSGSSNTFSKEIFTWWIMGSN